MKAVQNILFQVWYESIIAILNKYIKDKKDLNWEQVVYIYKKLSFFIEESFGYKNLTRMQVKTFELAAADCSITHKDIAEKLTKDLSREKEKKKEYNKGDVTQYIREARIRIIDNVKKKINGWELGEDLKKFNNAKSHQNELDISKKYFKNIFFKTILTQFDFENDIYNYGKILFENKDYIKAATTFSDVLYLNPDNKDAYDFKWGCIKNALENQLIKNLEFFIRILIDDNASPLKKEKNTLCFYSTGSGKLSVEFFDEVIFTQELRTEDILIPQDFYSTLNEKNLKPVVLESDYLHIEVQKSTHAAKITVKLKK
jgi:tetratricopeptide (TPR) repeat protein